MVSTFKARLILAAITVIAMMILVIYQFGLSAFKTAFVIGIITALAFLFFTSPSFREKERDWFNRRRMLEEERERARNWAIGEEQGRQQARNAQRTHARAQARFHEMFPMGKKR